MRLFSAIPYAYRVALMINASIVVVMAAFGGIVLDRQQKLLEEQFTHSGQLIATQFAGSALGPLFGGDKLGLSQQIKALTNDMIDISVFDHQGRIVASESASAGSKYNSNQYSYDNSKTDLVIKTTNKAEVEYNKELRTTINHIYTKYRNQWLEDTPMSFDWQDLDSKYQWTTFVAPVVFRDLVGGHVFVTTSRNEIIQAKNDILQFIMVVSFILVVAVFTLSMAIGRRLSRPVLDLIKATNAISDEEYSYRIDKIYHGEFGQLINSFNHMAEEVERKQKVETALTHFVSDSVADQYLSEGGGRGEGKMVDASVIFVDIVGFTSFSENNSAKHVAEILNEYFEYFTYCCEFYGGHVDKFIGDAAMFVFGAPNDDPEHPFNAAACAVLMQKIIADINKKHESEGKPCLEIRVGISCGQMLAGVIGSKSRLQYTVVGNPVNLSARLCDLAGSGGILVDEAFFDRANHNNYLSSGKRDKIKVKGVREEVKTVFIKDIIKTPYSHFETVREQLNLHA
ncbi:MAG: HAMP domain-containing protein [Saccharospirillaceae bacterium]|nr:HAMP domain-containing protein [Pseudomonadales bacterium]NRB78779.1 HAMP domain-containing protein [Saccharospirillaceae bacterium]